MSQFSVAVDSENSEKVITQSHTPVILDFWAPWCAPCKIIGKIIEELAEQYRDRVIVGKCNIDTAPELAQQFMVRSVPTLLFFKEGEVVSSLVGAVDRAVIEKEIEKMLSGEKMVRPLTMHV